MRSLKELEKASRLKIAGIMNIGTETYHGMVRLKGRRFFVVFGYKEDNYEHVSISALNPKVFPTWEQMCDLKEMFFYPEEMVVQIHPKESEYIHGIEIDGTQVKNVLHLWRPIDDKWEILGEG